MALYSVLGRIGLCIDHFLSGRRQKLTIACLTIALLVQPDNPFVNIFNNTGYQLFVH